MAHTHTITFADGTTTTSRREKIAGAVVLGTITEASKAERIRRAERELTEWLENTKTGYGSWTPEGIARATARHVADVESEKNLPIGAQYVASWHRTADLALKGVVAARRWSCDALTVVTLDESGNADLRPADTRTETTPEAPSAPAQPTTRHVVTLTGNRGAESHRKIVAKAIVVKTITAASRASRIAELQAICDADPTVQNSNRLRWARETVVGTNFVVSWHNRRNLALKKSSRCDNPHSDAITVVDLDENGCADLSGLEPQAEPTPKRPTIEADAPTMTAVARRFVDSGRDLADPSVRADLADSLTTAYTKQVNIGIEAGTIDLARSQMLPLGWDDAVIDGYIGAARAQVVRLERIDVAEGIQVVSGAHPEEKRVAHWVEVDGAPVRDWMKRIDAYTIEGRAIAAARRKAESLERPLTPRFETQLAPIGSLVHRAIGAMTDAFPDAEVEVTEGGGYTSSCSHGHYGAECSPFSVTTIYFREKVSSAQLQAILRELGEERGMTYEGNALHAEPTLGGIQFYYHPKVTPVFGRDQDRGLPFAHTFFTGATYGSGPRRVDHRGCVHFRISPESMSHSRFS